jgi:hypothetical protein
MVEKLEWWWWALLANIWLLVSVHSRLLLFVTACIYTFDDKYMMHYSYQAFVFATMHATVCQLINWPPYRYITQMPTLLSPFYRYSHHDVLLSCWWIIAVNYARTGGTVVHASATLWEFGLHFVIRAGDWSVVRADAEGRGGGGGWQQNHACTNLSTNIHPVHAEYELIPRANHQASTHHAYLVQSQFLRIKKQLT